MKTINLRRLVTISLLIAISVVLSRFLSITTPITKIGFAFLPIAFAGIWFGAIYGGLTAAIADIIGATLFPNGAFFPGFTLTAFLTGVIYGLILHKKPLHLSRISLAVLIITLVLHLGLNSVWLWMITGRALMIILPTRILNNAVLFPIQVISIYMLSKRLGQLFLSEFDKKQRSWLR